MPRGVRSGRGFRRAFAAFLIPIAVFAQGCIPRHAIKQPVAAPAKAAQQTGQQTAKLRHKVGLDFEGALSRNRKAQAENYFFRNKANKVKKAGKTREQLMLGNLEEKRRRILDELEMERIEKERRKSGR